MTCFPTLSGQKWRGGFHSAPWLRNQLLEDPPKHIHTIQINHIIVLHEKSSKRFARVVVPTGGGRHEAENKTTQFLSCKCDNEFRQFDSTKQKPNIYVTKSSLFPVRIGLHQGYPFPIILFLILINGISRRSCCVVWEPQGRRHDLWCAVDQFAAECEAAGMSFRSFMSETIVLSWRKVNGSL